MKYYGMNPDRITDTIRQLATWHNETPRLWMPDYQATAEEIMSTCQRMVDNDCYIALAGEPPVGFLWAEAHEDHVMILSLYVAPDHRHQNIATQLKLMLEDWCKANGIYRIKTTVHSTNVKMLQLNEKMGYEAKMVHMEKKL